MEPLLAILSYTPFYCLVIAGIWALIDRRQPFSKTIASLLLLLPAGIGEVWWFIFELFFSSEITKFQGWVETPFIQQLAFFDLAVGLGGIIAFFRKEYLFSLAVGTIAAIFLLGIAIDHIVSFAFQWNLALGHSSWTLSADLITAFGLIASLYNWKEK